MGLISYNYGVTLLLKDLTPRFKWFLARLIFYNIHQTYMRYDEIGKCIQSTNTILGSILKEEEKIRMACTVAMRLSL